MAVKLPGIPDPTTDPNSLRETLVMMKQAIEILGGQRGTTMANAVVTWQDLLNLGLIQQNQMPNKP